MEGQEQDDSEEEGSERATGSNGCWMSLSKPKAVEEGRKERVRALAAQEKKGANRSFKSFARSERSSKTQAQPPSLPPLRLLDRQQWTVSQRL